MLRNFWPLLAYGIPHHFSVQFSSVHFSPSVMSNSLWPHEPQHARPPCPSLTPGVHPNPWPLSWWCHPTISSSVIPFSSCPQSFPHQGLFKWVSFLHQVAKILEFQLQHQSFQRIWAIIQAQKNKILPFMATWIDLKGIKLSEIS